MNKRHSDTTKNHNKDKIKRRKKKDPKESVE